ncbi:MAG: methyltransferase [Pirellulales bacterium]
MATARHDLATAIYALSFWHYYLYWLAYRYGAVAPQSFKRDAILMKTASLALFGWAYAQSPLDVASLAVIAGGFLLNALAAYALGSDRTYYGYEVANLPPKRVTRFPYSWISHPMLLGNIAAFGGALLNGDFRQHFWLLACLHVALNLGLLLMEAFVTPQRRGANRPAQRAPRASAHEQREHVALVICCAAVGVGAGLWVAWRTASLVGASMGACIALYAYILYRCYAVPSGDVHSGWQSRGRILDER